MYLLIVFYTGNGSRPPWSALPQHLPAFHHGSGQWHQPKEQEQRLRWLILKQLVLLNCQAAKIRPVARSPRWSLAVWKVHVFCLWVLNFSFVFGFIEVLRGNMFAYIGLLLPLLWAFARENACMQLTVWLFTIYKMSPFSCRFKGKFPGATEHLKGPVFADGIFQKKIYKTHLWYQFQAFAAFSWWKGLVLQMVNTFP